MNLLMDNRTRRSASESLAEALRRSDAPTHETLGVRRHRKLNDQLRQLLTGEAGERR